MKEDYKIHAEIAAYNKGVIAHINSLTESDCPYTFLHTRKAWLAGFNEKGSIKEVVK